MRTGACSICDAEGRVRLSAHIRVARLQHINMNLKYGGQPERRAAI